MTLNSLTAKKLLQEMNSLTLMQELADAASYSYFYRGSNQSLDNIFISKNPGW